MARSGVESLRVVFSWLYAQPYATFAQVPANEAVRRDAVAGAVDGQGVRVRHLLRLLGLRRRRRVCNDCP